jgi:hypothetical protein
MEEVGTKEDEEEEKPKDKADQISISVVELTLL